ncbi:hypothetical protein GEMRC1_011389 [Eukaryota sp. GEM-RC1]
MSVRSSLIIFLSFFSLCLCKPFPVVGILAHPTPTALESYGERYIAASYVKWIDFAGARTVPVQFSSPMSEIRQLMSKLDGILLPGGLNFGNLPEVVCSIYQEAIAINKHRPFALFGTCLGFEQMAVCEGVELERFDSNDIALPLDISPQGFSSRILAGLDPQLLRDLQRLNVTFNNHGYGVSVREFQKSGMSENYVLVSENKDRQGKRFVSTFEHKLLPFFAVQWHPEKVLFEYDPTQSVPHGKTSVLVAQFFANQFVDYARKAQGTMTLEEAEARTFNALPVTYTFPIWSYFAQCYFFKD